MARIPESEIERLKREVSVERLVEARGVTLQRHGADLLGLCPFHDDHEPSLVVSPAKNLWHCLGACQAGGSVIDWVMRSEGISFRHAVERLREDRPGAPSPAAPPSAEPALAAASAAEDGEILRHVVRHYHATLKQSPEALAYLAERGLASSEMVERFQLGFANRTLAYQLPAGRRGAEIRQRLQALGILRDSGHEHFNGSLVVPIFDASGHVAEMYGRKITPNLRKGTPQHLYLPGPHRGVFNLEALALSKEIILCEALLDALSFWCAGFRNVTSAYGIEGFTAEHLAAFRQHGTERVLLAYDRDDAGDRAACALAAQLLEAGIGCFRIQFPRGMDANDYARKVTPASKSLGLAIRRALWLGNGTAPAPIETAAPKLDTPRPPAPPPSTDLASVASAPAPEATPSLSPLAAAFPPPAPATPPPAPQAPAPPAVPVEVRAQEVILALGDRRYRVRGLARNLA